jgi:hypothetical protein
MVEGMELLLDERLRRHAAGEPALDASVDRDG